MDHPLPDVAVRAALLDVAATVARACGRLIVDERPPHVGVAGTKTSHTDVVTLMDQRSEALARRMLGKLRPDDAVVGEEGSDRVGVTGITWLVDPIDGTVNYLYDIDEYAVSVAAVVGDGRRHEHFLPVAGAVYQPCTDELYLASSGDGAREVRGGVRRDLACSPAPDLASSLVGTGFAYDAGVRALQGAVMARVAPAARDIRRHGVAALDLCAVGRGRLDAYYEVGLNAWDYAAGWLIAREAGATVRGAGGRRPGRDLLLAGRPGVLTDLERLLG